MKESTFWKEHVKPNLDGFAQRIENSAGEGQPDVFWAYNGKQIWLELKVMRSGKIKTQPSQRLWLESILAGGCIQHVFYLVCEPKAQMLYVFRGADMLRWLRAQGAVVAPGAPMIAGNLSSAKQLLAGLWRTA